MNAQFLPTLRIIRSRLETIKFDYIEGVAEINEEKWMAAWNLCPNLKVLHANNVSIKGIRAVMGTPKYHLREITINSVYYYS